MTSPCWLVYRRGLNAATLIKIFARRKEAEAFAERAGSDHYVVASEVVL